MSASAACFLRAASTSLRSSSGAVGRHPAVLDVDAEAALGQIADVPLAGDDLVIGAQVLVDRLGLGRRFDDDQVFLLPCGHVNSLVSLRSESYVVLGCRVVRSVRCQGLDGSARQRDASVGCRIPIGVIEATWQLPHRYALHPRLVFALKFTTIAILGLVHQPPILHAFAGCQARAWWDRGGQDVLT